MSRSYIRAAWIPPTMTNRRKHSHNHRRSRRPYRSCGVCHFDKVWRSKNPRDERKKQDDIGEEIERYWDDKETERYWNEEAMTCRDCRNGYHAACCDEDCQCCFGEPELEYCIECGNELALGGQQTCSYCTLKAIGKEDKFSDV